MKIMELLLLKERNSIYSNALYASGVIKEKYSSFVPAYTIYFILLFSSPSYSFWNSRDDSNKCRRPR
jgi:hypothetical protein